MSLIEQLPIFYQNSPEMVSMQDALNVQTEAALVAMEDALAQLDVQTATWGLAYWERALGLSVDISKPEDYRRSRIISKLRGQGTTTVAMIKNVSESFSNGAVEVIEDPANYHFDIKFVGTIGIPPNMDDLTAAIEEIKPAHLGYAYIIIYNCWSDVSAKTWGALAAKTWGEVKEVAL